MILVLNKYNKNHCIDICIKYDEKNHFIGYQKDKKVRLNTVYPERMQAAYESAREYADAHGIKIYNATRGGELEVFERVNFDCLFGR